jgi:hypothetical protein
LPWCRKADFTGTHRGKRALAIGNYPHDFTMSRLDIDMLGSAGPNTTKFKTKSFSVAWCKLDGTVSVCELEEIQQHLNAVGLVWE